MKLISELWKDIEGFEGIYQISSKGNIRSLDRWVIDKNGRKVFWKSQPIKPRPQHKDGSGYLQVSLRMNGKYIHFLVHRLVAKAFIPNPNNLEQVNHIDENKHNNDVNNLEWLSRLDNTRYGTGIDRMAEKHSTAIMQLDMDGNVIKEWQSIRQAKMSVAASIWSAILEGRRICKGYVWIERDKYINMTKEQLQEFISNEVNKLKQKKINTRKVMSEKNSKPIVQLNLDGSFVKEWKSAKEAQNNGYKANDIRACVRGKQKTSRGYKWMDLEEYQKLHQTY